VTLPVLIAPGVVLIEGNLTVTQTITFNGLGAEIAVNGCVFLGSNEVEVELTKEELEELAKEGKLSKTILFSLIENDCVGATDLSTTKIRPMRGAGSKGCRKLRAENQGSTKSSLQIIFQVNSTNCSLMIILPCVFGGIIILAAVAIIIGLHAKKKQMAAGSASLKQSKA
jgi:hypothetical protein